MNLQDCLNAIAPVLPEFMGGSADLAPSNMTLMTRGRSFERTSDRRLLKSRSWGVKPEAEEPEPWTAGALTGGPQASRTCTLKSQILNKFRKILLKHFIT